MSLVRFVLERLLLILLWITRTAFLSFALATATALLGVSALTRPEATHWLAVATRAFLLIGGTFLVSGVLLFAAPRLRAPAGGEREGPPPWVWFLGVALIVLPALGYSRIEGLVGLWREILPLLDRVGFWDEIERGAQFSGLVMLPIMAALFVPMLASAAAFFLIVVPLDLLALLPTRSRLFPRLFTMLVVCQASLVIANLVATDAFSRLAADLIAVMNAAEDAEVRQAAEALGRAAGVLTTTAHALVAPLLGYLLWLPVLLGSQRAAAFFSEGSKRAPASTQSAALLEHPVSEPVPAPRSQPTAAHERTPAVKLALAPGRRARVALVVLGALMLLFAVAHELRPRARYASSDPTPGATLAAVPSAVRVSFGREIDPSSQLWVDRTMPGESALRVGVSSGLDPTDPQKRTLVAALSGASRGFYQVTWRSQPPSGGVGRSGSFRFAVGVPVPEGDAGGEPVLEERDAGARAQRKTVAGAVVLILLGVLLPHLPRER